MLIPFQFHVKFLQMWRIACILINMLTVSSAGIIDDDIRKVEYQYKIEDWLNNIDSNLSQFNLLAAQITWKLSTDPNEKTERQARELGKARNRWKNKVCESTVKSNWMTPEQQRKMYLLCRGPKFDDEAALKYLRVLGELANEYNSQICLNNNLTQRSTAVNFPKPGDCFYGEPDLERLLKRNDLNPDELKWIWLNWHDSVGERVKPLFQIFNEYQNEAARNNGYQDIGETWREELEIPDLEQVVFKLYEEVRPLYVLLHAVVRDLLYKKYGPLEIDPAGLLPIHLLGNMWGQDWSTLSELFTNKKLNLDEHLKRKNVSVKDMVYEAEDFYTSLSLPKMTRKFWKFSVFEQNENATLCHGSAANLYSKDDFRMLMCGQTTMDDFYIIHHEMGHIEYYMAYAEQPSIFQDGTNTAFHESIGDAIMHGVMTPQHLHRLGLLTDDQLLDKDTEFLLLLEQALAKIPEIPFALIIDKYRWEIFKENVAYDSWNHFYWKLNEKFRGVAPPQQRDGKGFDAGGKFHVPDNTPYIRYFLSSIIQMQIFKSLCEVSLYGSNINDSYSPRYLPLHRCDIYGSKNAGKKLLSMMENGASIKWFDALLLISGSEEISTKPLLEYYHPVYQWLENYVRLNNVPVGW